MVYTVKFPKSTRDTHYKNTNVRGPSHRRRQCEVQITDHLRPGSTVVKLGLEIGKLELEIEVRLDMLVHTCG